jgi:TonB family protein
VRPFVRDLTIYVFAGATLLFAQPYTMAAPPSAAHRAILTRVTPIYPELARRMHICGQVTVRAIILPSGAVSETHVESGHALLRQAAEYAVHRWRFASAPGSDPSELIVNVLFDDSDSFCKAPDPEDNTQRRTP